MVERLFKGYTGKDVKKNKDKKPKSNAFAFLSRNKIKNSVDKMIGDLDVQEAIGAAIKESVKSYTRDKK